MEAGFQCNAPAESIAQPVAAPAIDSFTGLTPRKAMPCPTAAGLAARIQASKTTAIEYRTIME